MKPSRLILSIVMLLGLSDPAGACIINNLRDGAIFYTGLTITRHQNLINTYPSATWPDLNVSSNMLGSEIGHPPDAYLRDTVYKSSFMNNIKTTDLGHIDYYGLEQSGREHNNPAPVPEPSTLLLIGSGLLVLAGVIRRVNSKEGL